MEVPGNVSKEDQPPIDTLKSVENKPDIEKLKSKYTKGFIKPLLDDSKIEISKFNPEKIEKIKQKYLPKLSTKFDYSKIKINGIVPQNSAAGPSKKQRKLKKKFKKSKLNSSDPDVTNISNLLSNSLLIESPEKNMSGNKSSVNDGNENKDNSEISANKHLPTKSAWEKDDAKEFSHVENSTDQNKENKHKTQNVDTVYNLNNMSSEDSKIDVLNDDSLDELVKKKNKKTKVLTDSENSNDSVKSSDNLEQNQSNSNKSSVTKDSEKVEIVAEEDVIFPPKKENKKEKQINNKDKENKNLVALKVSKSSTKEKKSRLSLSLAKNKKREKSKTPKETKKVVFRTDKNVRISPSKPIEKPENHSENPKEMSKEKKNAFQFMMDSRHKSIGSNSPGKDKVEENINPAEKEEKKSKLKNRKLVLEDWAEKRGGTKRKMEEEAKERYIEKTLNKRAKRMKELLSVKTEDKNKGIIKSKNRKSLVLNDSENSSDSESNLSNKEQMCETSIKNDNIDSEKIEIIKKENSSFSPLPNTQKNKVKQNSKDPNDDILFSPSLKKTSLLHYFDVTNKSTNAEDSSKDSNASKTNIEPSEVIKIKLNFTSKRSKNESIVTENMSLSSNSKTIKKKHKHSLSLRKDKKKEEKNQDCKTDVTKEKYSNTEDANYKDEDNETTEIDQKKSTDEIKNKKGTDKNKVEPERRFSLSLKTSKKDKKLKKFDKTQSNTDDENSNKSDEKFKTEISDKITKLINNKKLKIPDNADVIPLSSEDEKSSKSKSKKGKKSKKYDKTQNTDNENSDKSDEKFKIEITNKITDLINGKKLKTSANAEEKEIPISSENTESDALISPKLRSNKEKQKSPLKNKNRKNSECKATVVSSENEDSDALISPKLRSKKEKHKTLSKKKERKNSTCEETIISSENEDSDALISPKLRSKKEKHKTLSRKKERKNSNCEEISISSENEDSDALISPKLSSKKEKHKSRKKERKNSKCEDITISYENEDSDDLISPKLSSKKEKHKSRKKEHKNSKSEKTTPVSKHDILGDSSKFTPRTWHMKVRLFEKGELDEAEEMEGEILEISEEEDESFDDEIFPLHSSFDSKKLSQNSSISSNKVIDSVTKKEVKIAPLFLMQNKKQEAEAKKKFLYSGVPLKMKKMIKNKKAANNNEDFELSLFPTLSHIQQREEEEMEFWDLPNTSLIVPEIDDSHTDDLKINMETMRMGTFTDCKNIINIPKNGKILHVPPGILPNIKTFLQELKKECNNFPVFKVFRLLSQKCGTRFVLPPIEEKKEVKKEEIKTEEPVKRKRGRPRKKKVIVDDNSIIIEDTTAVTSSQKSEISAAAVSIWTDKYKPQSSEDIFGNYSSVDELKKWLQAWVNYSKEYRNTKVKRKRLNSGSSDDFCSDSDTRDSETTPQNTMILIGPYGSGKTSTVYALSNELNLNVIEINASSKRPGKKILLDLQEATKSYQVKNTDASSVGSFFQKISPENSQEEEVTKKLTLLLIEDADIVFEDQDDGFINAITQLIAFSKRPIIITTSDPNCAHLQKLLIQHKTIKFSPLSSKVLGTWLQILCLIEGIRVNKTEVSRLLDWNKGDIRKTILQLQFWTLSGGDQVKKSNKQKILTNFKSSRRFSSEVDMFYEDESSNLSWMTEDTHSSIESVDSDKIHNSCLDCFVPYYQKDNSDFQLIYPLDLGNLWWNISAIFGFSNIAHNKIFTDLKLKPLEGKQSENPTQKKDDAKIIEDCKKSESPDLFSTQSSLNKNTDFNELNAVGDLLDIIAFSDIVYSQMKFERDFEPCSDYWKIGTVDSLSVEENYSTYNDINENSLEIIQWLVENNIKHYREISGNNLSDLDINQAAPTSEEIRWRKKQHKTMLKLSVPIPTTSQLDRRSLCVDYQSTLRTICRSEQIRSVSSAKRNGRFYHYLRGLNVNLTDPLYEVVCNTLAHHES